MAEKQKKQKWRDDRTVCLVSFNNPELTEAAIMSLRKHGGEDYRVIVWDNSSDIEAVDGTRMKARPFKKRMAGVTVIDNTRGQRIDFEKEIRSRVSTSEEYGSGGYSRWGSAKHIMSVQALWDYAPQGFVLMESDTLLKQSIDHLFRPDLSAIGHPVLDETLSLSVERLSPLLCWLNVPMLREHGARYYDPDRCWGLSHGGSRAPGNHYDTGACLLEDVRKDQELRANSLRIDIRPLMVHFGGGTWKVNKEEEKRQWLEQHGDLWKPDADATGTVADGGSKPQARKRTNSKAK